MRYFTQSLVDNTSTHTVATLVLALFDTPAARAQREGDQFGVTAVTLFDALTLPVTL